MRNRKQLLKKNRESFLREVCLVAVSVALQSMLQSSFSMIDQIMIGQMGAESIAAIGIAGKFLTIFNVVAAAVGTVAGIMIAQYIGAEDEEEADRSFRLNLAVAAGIGAGFMLLCISVPRQIMELYIRDGQIVSLAAEYLRILGAGCIPAAAASILATALRCRDRADWPLYVSILAALINTGLNYLLIFGKCGMEALGVAGAAIATLLSQLANGGLLLLLYLGREREARRKSGSGREQSFGGRMLAGIRLRKMSARAYLWMLLPILANEFMWSLGENIYGVIYGHLGTISMAAMTLTNPVQGLMIGAMSGLAQAAGILIGKRLGDGDFGDAYEKAKKIALYGLIGSVLLSGGLLLLKGPYVDIYRVEPSVKELGIQVLMVYACICPVKVLNMIVGGGILRSGGKTRILLGIDLIGTWVFGVPLGLFSAFLLRLPLPSVYLMLSLEECVRLGIEIFVFRRKAWMQRIG